jgi:malonate-semialdehyde dehydrogenase (acetylating)/methylmalonate-semialdehyde dehydrogenase
VNTIQHWINGTTVTAAQDSRFADVVNPATGVTSGKVALASADQTREGIRAAAEAFPAWRDTSLTKRTSIMFAFRELLNARKQELAEIITAEHGKVVSDALGEVSRGLEVVELACNMPYLLKGGHTENASTGVDVHSVRQPVGVAAIISPFNFPAMVPLWFFPVAIAAGNTVVLKPSEKDPSAANWLAELWKEAGLPDGVFNVVHGDKESVDTLLTDEQVDSVSFVGSTPIAKYIYETASAHGKRVQALGGAKNHMLVLPDADLDITADSAVNAGYGAAGERCMAISVVVAVEDIADELVAKIAERTRNLKVGDGTREPDMGPLITVAHRDKVAGYIDAGVEAGAELVLDGRTTSPDADSDAASYEEGLELINANPYGNGTAIFTNDGGAARKFENEVQVGMIGVNVPIPVPMAYFSFGGWKNSLFGDTHAYGAEGVHFFTRGKVVTKRWLDPSHGGINLGFPTNS